MNNIVAMADPLEHVLPHRYFGIPINFPGFHGTFWFTNQIAMMLVASLMMLIIFPALFHKPRIDAPSGWRNFFEAIMEYLRLEVFQPILMDFTEPFLPFLWTLFFFILFCNVLGLLPLAQLVEIISGGRIHHLGGAATGAITTTATLAFITFLFIHSQGLYVMYKSLRNGTYGHHDHHGGEGTPFAGLGDPLVDTHQPHPHHREKHMPVPEALLRTVPNYLWNFAPHPFKDKGPFMDVMMWFPLLLMELLGALIKPFALCMRLFGNMVSGHIVLAVLIALIVSVPNILGEIGVGVPIMALDILIQLLEVLVAFLHAYIFVFLAAMFISGAVSPEH